MVERTMSDGERIRLLLVDGYQEDRRYWAERFSLSTERYEVVEAHDGQAGLQHCRQGLVHCALLELLLPDMPGFEVLRALVQMAGSPRFGVLVLTRIESTSLLDLAKRNGALAAFTKARTSRLDLDYAILGAMYRNGRRQPQGNGP
ncbi:MAG TPA: response regulator [Nitrospira sp.]|nr:response regulator [Nitrospira sp.]